MSEYSSKEIFVHKYLLPAVQAARAGIVDMEYETMRSGAGEVVSECVVIRHKCGYNQRVIVSGCSLLRIAIDVMRAVS